MGAELRSGPATRNRNSVSASKGDSDIILNGVVINVVILKSGPKAILPARLIRAQEITLPLIGQTQHGSESIRLSSIRQSLFRPKTTWASCCHGALPQRLPDGPRNLPQAIPSPYAPASIRRPRRILYFEKNTTEANSSNDASKSYCGQ